MKRDLNGPELVAELHVVRHQSNRIREEWICLHDATLFVINCAESSEDMRIDCFAEAPCVSVFDLSFPVIAFGEVTVRAFQVANALGLGRAADEPAEEH